MQFEIKCKECGLYHLVTINATTDIGVEGKILDYSSIKFKIDCEGCGEEIFFDSDKIK
jgi:ribosomal protein S27E